MSGLMVKRRSTLVLGGCEVDLSVLAFSVQEGSSMSADHPGVHRKELMWKLQVGRGTEPMLIRVSVEWKVLRTPEVCVECNGRQVFPQGVGSTVLPKCALREDFAWTLPFRGTVTGIGVKDHFLIRPRSGFHEQWYLATVNAQRKDGNFEAIANIPDGNGGVRQIFMPAVQAQDLKYSGSMELIEVPQRSMKLTVPKLDPMEAVLEVDGTELITQHFARITPPFGKEAKVTFKVSKDRRSVATDCGHAVFSQFLAGDVFLVQHMDLSPMRKSLGQAVGVSKPLIKQSWEVQFGPFARHKIEIEKKHRTHMPYGNANKLVKVTVDGQLLVEATPEDLQCPDGDFICKFMLKGEKTLSFEVYETSQNGNQLDSRGVVNRISKYKHECKLVLRDDKFERSVDFLVDGTSFRELPFKATDYVEPDINVTPEVLMLNYGIVVPFKVTDFDLPSLADDMSLANLKNNLETVVNTFANNSPGEDALVGARRGMNGNGGILGSLLTMCCSANGDHGAVTITADSERRYDSYGRPGNLASPTRHKTDLAQRADDADGQVRW